MATSTARLDPDPQITAQQNKALVAEFMEVFSSGDVDAILSFLAPNATWWVGGTIDGISGTKNKEEFGAMLAGLSATTKTGAIALKPLAWTAEGDRVAVETESYSEMANGRVYNNLYHFVFVVRDGKIHEVKEFLDTEHTRAVFLD
ncbi:nuclear transport factor 2 family protein [Gordonia sp. zg691]|uniref:Nuclear transport factor 2 family protein n=1 Tax=Gordonia jinghuaiqii TaxID=2758710 RepID=A0A7D7RSI0_9ACTN|nr:nuclear transport factor 2 family protein [Gordonia jinghuaiqii]MBD0862007.1 nuclear transport factor 2 family protein [Gordonia jinghuaiqii]MCR5978768.1 nuclear transport factor 2 family protein [Gordonia jinghuaiqii]QMT03073.1 nuclear transport factor 2 family protein [Gordonia jinghuaiqii]